MKNKQLLIMYHAIFSVNFTHPDQGLYVVCRLIYYYAVAATAVGS